VPQAGNDYSRAAQEPLSPLHKEAFGDVRPIPIWYHAGKTAVLSKKTIFSKLLQTCIRGNILSKQNLKQTILGLCDGGGWQLRPKDVIFKIDSTA
jgi:hypothetical protein